MLYTSLKCSRTSCCPSPGSPRAIALASDVEGFIDEEEEVEEDAG